MEVKRSRVRRRGEKPQSMSLNISCRSSEDHGADVVWDRSVNSDRRSCNVAGIIAVSLR